MKTIGLAVLVPFAWSRWNCLASNRIKSRVVLRWRDDEGWKTSGAGECNEARNENDGSMRRDDGFSGLAILPAVATGAGVAGALRAQMGAACYPQ